MKKLFSQFDELWIAVTFAEAGEYDCLRDEQPRPLRCIEPARIQAL